MSLWQNLYSDKELRTARHGESENDSDATIYLVSESEDEYNVEIENRKDERGEPEIEDAITSNNNVQVDNPDPVTPKDTEVKNNGKRNNRRLKRPRKKNFACENCQKKFYATKYLIYHRRIHLKQFSNHCKICLRIFPESSGLRVDHESVCRKLRYECYACKLIVVGRTELMKHMRTHSGEMPFKCTRCVKRFSQKM